MRLSLGATAGLVIAHIVHETLRVMGAGTLAGCSLMLLVALQQE